MSAASLVEPFWGRGSTAASFPASRRPPCSGRCPSNQVTLEPSASGPRLGSSARPSLTRGPVLGVCDTFRDRREHHAAALNQRYAKGLHAVPRLARDARAR